MYHAGTVGQSDVGIAGDKISFFALLLRHFRRAVKERFVLFVLQILSGVTLQHLISRCVLRAQLSKHRVEKRLSHIICLPVCRLYLHIGFHRIDAERHVGRQCPGGRGPCQNIRILVLHFKTHHCRAFFHIFITLCHLMGGQRRPAAGAVGHDLKALVQKPLVPDRL